MDENNLCKIITVCPLISECKCGLVNGTGKYKCHFCIWGQTTLVLVPVSFSAFSLS